jgi:ankyrin repeat protein
MDSFQILEHAVWGAIIARKFGNMNRRLENMYDVLGKTDADVNQHTVGTKTLLQTAVSAGDFDVVKMLLCSGANPNIVYCDARGDSRSALDCLSEICHMRGEQERYNIAEILMQYDADVNTRSTRRSIPLLHICCSYGDLKFVELLFAYGVDTATLFGHEGGQLSITPLVFAVRNKYHPENTVPLIQLLMRHGANIHLTDRYKHTLLHAIATNKNGHNLSAMHFLVNHGVKDSEDKDGCSAGELAVNSAGPYVVSQQKAKQFGDSLHEMFEEYQNGQHFPEFDKYSHLLFDTV